MGWLPKASATAGEELKGDADEPTREGVSPELILGKMGNLVRTEEGGTFCRSIGELLFSFPSTRNS